MTDGKHSHNYRPPEWPPANPWWKRPAMMLLAHAAIELIKEGVKEIADAFDIDWLS